MRLARTALIISTAFVCLRATAADKPPDEVTLLAVGDVMLSRGVAEAIDDHDENYPFESLHDLLRSPDILFGNLEGPIIAGRAVKSGAMVFRADPGVEAGLKEAGFTIMSLANNHTPDHGAKGIASTMAALQSVGISAVGAGANDDEARRPVIIERHGLRFAFLAYNDPSVVPKSYGSGPDHPGTNLVDVDHVAADVVAARAKADFVIVSMHHGWEYRKRSPWQVKFAHAAIDGGADLVIGHHPHVVQSVELYRGKYIAYSLGNFVFDQTFSDSVREGVILKAQFTRHGIASLQFLPFRIAGAAQPRLTTDPKIIRRIFKRLEIPLDDDGRAL